MLLGLLISSIWFGWDIWDKYQSEKTSFSIDKEKFLTSKYTSEGKYIFHNDVPTTVLCFSPYGKDTVLEKYNLSRQNLVYISFPGKVKKLPWNEFSKEVSYIAGRDFNLTFSYLTNGIFIFNTELAYM